MADSHISSLDVVDTLALGGTTVTLTAAEMNTLHSLGLSGTGGFFDKTFTTAVIKAQNHTANLIVPGITGKKFYAVFAAMCAAGSVTTATTIRLVETSVAGVVLSHVAADMTDGAWVGPTGGTPVITNLNTALPISAGIEIVDVAANSLTVTTAIRVIVAGYYI
jgi:hypothetical protein